MKLSSLSSLLLITTAASTAVGTESKSQSRIFPASNAIPKGKTSKTSATAISKTFKAIDADNLLYSKAGKSSKSYVSCDEYYESKGGTRSKGSKSSTIVDSFVSNYSSVYAPGKSGKSKRYGKAGKSRDHVVNGKAGKSGDLVTMDPFRVFHVSQIASDDQVGHPKSGKGDNHLYTKSGKSKSTKCYFGNSKSGQNFVFDDFNGDGLLGRGDSALPGVSITLICDEVAVASVFSGADGMYEFEGVVPGSYCYVEVDPKDDFVFSPVVEGGNQICSNGTSSAKYIGEGGVHGWDVGMYMKSSAPSVSIQPSISTVPSLVPSASPSVSAKPSSQPYAKPSFSRMPTPMPSELPSVSISPSSKPTGKPSVSSFPSLVPSASPTISTEPSITPSIGPSLSGEPSVSSSIHPSLSGQPSVSPSIIPSSSSAPSISPTISPSSSGEPSVSPSIGPSLSDAPTPEPSLNPPISIQPSSSMMPSSGPGANPNMTSEPSSIPSLNPSASHWPTRLPSESPSVSIQPSVSTVPSLKVMDMLQHFKYDVNLTPPFQNQPSMHPSVTHRPTSTPSESPSVTTEPSVLPSMPPSLSGAPSNLPSMVPSLSGAPSTPLSLRPSLSGRPSVSPSISPSLSGKPSVSPSIVPSLSSAPSSFPSIGPSLSGEPSITPSIDPSLSPSIGPSSGGAPSSIPSEVPTQSGMPSGVPSSGPTPTDPPVETLLCVSDSLFVDQQGRTCEWYQDPNLETGVAGDRCPSLDREDSSLLSDKGMAPWDACCFCGGGSFGETASNAVDNKDMFVYELSDHVEDQDLIFYENV